MRKAVHFTVVFCSVLILMVVMVQTATAKPVTININTASVKELVKLKGVGEKLAQKIIQFREKEPFVKPEDITKVSGIGNSIFEKNKELIVVK